MDLKSFALVVCLLIGNACAQDNQSLYTGLDGIGSSPNVGSRMNSTELASLPRADVSLQKIIDDAMDNSSIPIPSGSYILSEPLHINKNITLTGSPSALLDAQGTGLLLQIDNPRASVNLEMFMFIRGKGDNGGAISSQARSLTIKECRFSDNFANCGTAIYQKDGNLRIMNSSFENNNATDRGAAIYDEGGNMQVESSTFTQNPGTHVICINGARPMQAKVLIRDCNVSNNSGIHGSICDFSGAVACINSTTLIDHRSINGNKAMKTKPGHCGINAGLFTFFSNVTLNDTRIERNEAFSTTAMNIHHSKVKMNRCSIKGNHAREVVNMDEYYGYGRLAGIYINPKSEVTMNDTIIEGNIADSDCGAIENAGKLNLNPGTIITGNTARKYSAIENMKSGIINISKDVDITDNYNKLQPYLAVHNKGVMNTDLS